MIKILRYIILLLILSVTLSYASQVDELMTEANNAYLKKNYTAAIADYEKIINNGYISPELYYNLGNAYFRVGKLGYAILYYEKALKLAPDDEDIIYNLKIANARIVDKIKEVPQLFLIKWWNIIITSVSVSGWLTLVLVFYLLLLFSIGLFFLSKKIKLQREAFLTGIISLALLFLSVVFLYSRINKETSSQYGVLLEPSETVKVSPDPKGEDAFVIHEGTKFKIEDELENWAKIKLADGKVGWVNESVIGKI